MQVQSDLSGMLIRNSMIGTCTSCERCLVRREDIKPAVKFTYERLNSSPYARLSFHSFIQSFFLGAAWSWKLMVEVLLFRRAQIRTDQLYSFDEFLLKGVLCPPPYKYIFTFLKKRHTYSNTYLFTHHIHTPI